VYICIVVLCLLERVRDGGQSRVEPRCHERTDQVAVAIVADDQVWLAPQLRQHLQVAQGDYDKIAAPWRLRLRSDLNLRSRLRLQARMVIASKDGEDLLLLEIFAMTKRLPCIRHLEPIHI
jgi:hypothetical protein